MASLPTVSIVTTDGTATEGVTDDGLSFTLTRTGDLSGTLTVNVDVAGATRDYAENGRDYVDPPRTVTFQAGSTTAVLNVAIIDDAISEVTEGIYAVISRGDGYVVSDNSAYDYASILDNDLGSTPLPTVSIVTTDGTATEGVTDDGLSFTLTRTGDLSGTLTVNVDVAGATRDYAENGRDYVDPPRTVTFQAGSTTAVLNVAIIDDAISEVTEGIYAVISRGDGYVVSDNSAYDYASILDNDLGSTPLPTVSIVTTDGTATEGVTDDGLSFTLTRTGDLSGTLTVNVDVAGATRDYAENGRDYVDPPRTVTFQAGSTTAVLNVAIIDDAISEVTEGIYAVISRGDGYVVSDNSAYDYASILDNDITGGDEDDTLTGGDGNDTLIGGAGADLLYGRGGNDLYYVDNPRDQVIEALNGGIDRLLTSVSYTLAAGQEVEQLEVLDVASTTAINLTGNAFANTLIGSAGANVLNGGGGADTLIGGAGNDTYVTDGGDTITEADDEGTDTVQSSVALSLGANLENLTLTGTAAINGTGNALANVLIGNSGNNILNGLGGADTMRGGAGSDTYYVDDARDRAIETNGAAGVDLVCASASFSLGGSELENLTLTGTGHINGTGNSIANVITGNGGDNILNGLGGADTMRGGAGSDTYYVDDARDRAIETNGAAGVDLVCASASFSLGGSELENLTLTGTGHINGTGNSIANIITGNGGDNILNGLGGADTMIGGAGSDTYYVDDARDRAIEINGATGTDRVIASVSFSLDGSELENLTLTGTGHINGTGNSLANVIVGNGGNNILNGMGGADRMIGGAGSDTYFVDNVGDRAVEADGAAGIDTVYASVSFSLGGSALENMVLAGTTGLNGTGNSLANTLKGNTGANALNGGLGNDTLTGLAGKDTFVFATVLGASNVDRITDFSAADDTIQLSKSIFTALSAGTLAAGAFKDLSVSGAKVDADDRILYNKTTGALSYDADGNGSKAAVQFAVLDNKAALTSADFLIA